MNEESTLYFQIDEEDKENLNMNKINILNYDKFSSTNTDLTCDSLINFKKETPIDSTLNDLICENSLKDTKCLALEINENDLNFDFLTENSVVSNKVDIENGKNELISKLDLIINDISKSSKIDIDNENSNTKNDSVDNLINLLNIDSFNKKNQDLKIKNQIKYSNKLPKKQNILLKVVNERPVLKSKYNNNKNNNNIIENENKASDLSVKRELERLNKEHENMLKFFKIKIDKSDLLIQNLNLNHEKKKISNKIFLQKNISFENENKKLKQINWFNKIKQRINNF